MTGSAAFERCQQLAALGVVDRGGPGSRGVDAWVGLLTIALHGPLARPRERIARGWEWLGQHVGRERVHPVVDRRCRYYSARFHRLVAARARCRAGKYLVRIAIPRVGS